MDRLIKQLRRLITAVSVALAKWERRCDAAEWRRGYEWAAVRLLLDELTPQKIDAYTDGNSDAFALGAMAAVRRLTKSGAVPDDRPRIMGRPCD